MTEVYKPKKITHKIVVRNKHRTDYSYVPIISPKHTDRIKQILLEALKEIVCPKEEKHTHELTIQHARWHERAGWIRLRTAMDCEEIKKNIEEFFEHDN